MLDFLLHTDNDIIIKDGDITIGVSDLQHQELILVCHKGEFKESPLATVGVVNYLRDDDIPAMEYEIMTRFEGDGMAVKRVKYNEDNGSLDYAANYQK